MNGQDEAVEQGAGAKVVVEATVLDIVQDINLGTEGTVMDITVTITDLDTGIINQMNNIKEENKDTTCKKDNSTPEILTVAEISTEVGGTPEDNQRAQDQDLQKDRDLQKVEKKRIEKKNSRLKHLTRNCRIQQINTMRMRRRIKAIITNRQEQRLTLRNYVDLS